MKRLFPVLLLFLTLGSLSSLFRCAEHTAPLVISVTADSSVGIGDTALLYFSTDETTETVTWYIRYEDSWRLDSTTDNRFSLVWSYPDTGLQHLVVFARADDGRISGKDTVTLNVHLSVPAMTISSDSAVYVYDSSVFSVGLIGSDDFYELVWTKDNETPRIIPFDTVFGVMWELSDTGTRTIQAYALGRSGLRSSVDSIEVMVNHGAPDITVHCKGSVVSVNDTTLLAGDAKDPNGHIIGYLWTRGNDSINEVIGTADTVLFVWSLSDTGKHVVYVQAIDDDSLFSSPDSCIITVTADRPVIKNVLPGQAMAGATSDVVAKADDNDGSIIGYRWTVTTAAGSIQKDTDDSVMTHTWTMADIGLCEVVVEAVDDDSLWSHPVRCTLLVHSTVPVLRHVHDTVISSSDTLRIIRAPADSTTAINYWFFAVNGGGWVESDSPELQLFYQGSNTIRVKTGVLDNDSAFFSDTFTVTFNLPPVVTSPVLSDGDTLWTNEGAVPGIVPLPVVVTEPEQEAFSVQLLWGDEGVQDTLTDSDTLRVAIDSTGAYRFSFTVADAFGNTVMKEGVIHVGVEHTICFAGHSIPVGVGDTTLSGGFRPFVLEQLRAIIGPLGRIRARGPFTTDQTMLSPADDSCFAISGSFAREMLMLMDHAYTDLTADIWVMMLGVNGSFSNIETQATIDLMNRILTRNPAARLYVLTSQPYNRIPEIQRNYYNDNVRSNVQTLRDSGFAAFIVETGDSTLYDSTTATFNDTLSFDAVHPNVLGYTRMGDAIVKVMQERDPHVLGVSEEE